MHFSLKNRSYRFISIIFFGWGMGHEFLKVGPRPTIPLQKFCDVTPPPPFFFGDIRSIARLSGMSRLCILDFSKTCTKNVCLFQSPPALHHWPQYMDSWLARFCILDRQCVPPETPRQPFYSSQNIGSTHWLMHMSVHEMQQVTGFSFKFHEKKMEKFPRSSRLLNIYWKLLKKNVDVNEFKICAILNHSCSVWYQWTCKVNVVRVVIAIHSAAVVQ